MFVHYITLKDLSDAKLSSLNWPELITLKNCNPNSLQCDRCQTVSEILPTTSVVASKALFIEFASDALNTLSFVKEFSLCNSLFSLKAVVFCNNRHFTCGVEWNGIWLYIDDMCKPVQSFSHLADRFVKNTNAFFGIYVEKSEIVENNSNQSKNDIRKYTRVCNTLCRYE